MKRWHLRSQFKWLCRLPNINFGPSKVEGCETFTQTKNKFTFELTEALFSSWKTAARQCRLTSTLRSKQVLKQKNLWISGKKYSTSKDHLGDSLIEFLHSGKKRHGKIAKFFSSTETGNREWVIVEPFESLDNSEECKNPFRNFAHVNCYLVKNTLNYEVVIDSDSITGHVALLENKEGTFEIPYRTVCLAALQNLVSHCFFEKLGGSIWC